MPDYLTVCEQAARSGGKVLMDLRGSILAREKGPNDLVTEADLASQQAICEILLGCFPDHQFVGEETEGAIDLFAHRIAGTPPSDVFRWIVDPLDGTTNYVHGLPNYAVSVALERGGEVLVGVIYDPCADECFRAVRGGGAQLNGRKLQSSGCRRLAEALIAMSLPAQVTRDSPDVKRFLEIIEVCRSVRRMGSAALNLCYVAAGRLDAYVVATVKPWDVAAGQLIAREAGVQITGIRGEEFDLFQPELASAATSELHAELLGVLSRVD